MSHLDPRSLLRRNSVAALPFLTYAMPIEPIAILSVILATARSINSWLQDRGRKKAIVNDLAKVIQLLCNILQPLHAAHAAQNLDRNVISVLLDIAESLATTKEHLTLWSAKSTTALTLIGVLAPEKVIDFLKDDQLMLKERISLLTLSLQVSRMHTSDLPTGHPGYRESAEDYLEGIINSDVRAFWGKNFGQTLYIGDSSITSALSRWTKQDFDQELANALLRVIDTKDIGITTIKNLAIFTGDRTIAQAISEVRQSLRERRRSIPDASLLNPNVPPQLVWIDDCPQNNTTLVYEAESKGISVVQLPSTAVAKLWIEHNFVQLQQLELANKLRFITDNARWERDHRKEQFLNLSAGELTLRFVRGKGFTSPVLVYTGASIPTTRYVTKFSRAGSTVCPRVCTAFITELATGIENRRSLWEGFDM